MVASTIVASTSANWAPTQTPRADAEGQVGEAVGRGAPGQEAGRVEGLRVVPELLVAVEDPGETTSSAPGGTSSPITVSGPLATRTMV
jgi:hypothetical protein